MTTDTGFRRQSSLPAREMNSESYFAEKAQILSLYLDLDTVQICKKRS